MVHIYDGFILLGICSLVFGIIDMTTVGHWHQHDSNLLVFVQL